MKVMLGVWIDSDDAAANEREVDAAIRLANEYPEIVLAVCVGNETQVAWSAHRCPLDVLLEHVRHVRAAVADPVTVADDLDYWLEPESRALAAEIDFITLHAHPLWKGQQLDDALPWLREQVAKVEELHPDRLVVLGETGWATSASDTGEQATLIKGEVGESEQKAFYEAVRAWAAEERVTVFWFEAFDENWKGGDDPDDVEKHWGLFRADRTPKAALLSKAVE
jgi:exo-beta-1,3-glucanase (GH17 family)